MSAAVATALLAGTRARPTFAKSALQTYSIPHTDLVVSRIAYGCSRLVGWYKQTPSAYALAKAEKVINSAHESGITLFDLADGYGYGHTEAAFGTVLKRSPGLRDRIVVQTKCGLRSKDSPLPLDSFAVDLSRTHITAAVDGSLKRLQTDRLDILLLHAFDTLVRSDEVAQAFNQLKRAGKVRYFGVSNFTPGQIEFLKQSLAEPVVVNQIPLGLPRPGLISANGTMDYCRRNAVQVQAYSPLRGDLLKPDPDYGPEVQEMARFLRELARQKNTNPSAIALAWLLHHPAGIVPIIGSTNPQHIAENCDADRVTLSRADWYELYNLAQTLPPQGNLRPNAD